MKTQSEDVTSPRRGACAWYLIVVDCIFIAPLLSPKTAPASSEKTRKSDIFPGPLTTPHDATTCRRDLLLAKQILKVGQRANIPPTRCPWASSQTTGSHHYNRSALWQPGEIADCPLCLFEILLNESRH